MIRIYHFAVLILLLLVNTSPVISIPRTQQGEWSGQSRLTFTDERPVALANVLEGNNSNVIYAESKSGAQQGEWSEDIRLTFSEGRSVTPAIAVEENNVHVVYSDNEGGGKYERFLWYINSSDYGNTWNSPICLVNNSSITVSSPKITVYEYNIHIIWLDWNDKRIHYIQSIDNGINWSNEKILTPIIYPYLANWDIAVFELNLHIVYIDSDNKLTYINSNDNGANWSPSKVLLPSISMVGESVIAVNKNCIHIAIRIVRERMSKLVGDILYIKSLDHGVNWSKEIDISSLPGVDTSSDFPDITVADNDIYVIYRDNGPGGIRQIFYSHSSDNGIIWEKRIQLSNSSYGLVVAPVVLPTIAAEGDNVWAVWEDFRNATDGDIELYSMYSTNSGDTWSAEIRLTTAPEDSIQPDILIREGKVHLVWSDNRESNREIFYKHIVTFPPMIYTGVDIKPDTLNLKSKGRWITAYIILNNPYDVNDIDINSVILEGIIPAEWGDIQGDRLMVKFDRGDVQDLLPVGTYNLKVTGELADGTSFEGYSDEIRVIDPGK